MKNVIHKSVKLLLGITLVLTFQNNIWSQSNNFRFQQLLQEKPNEPIATAVKNNGEQTLRYLAEQKIQIKYITKEYIYVNMTPTMLNNAQKNNKIEQFHFEYSSGQALMDSSNVKTYVTNVHQGLGNLPQAYTGKDVIIGYVDQGLDYNHPDFKDTNGNTRVLRYWDQAMASNNPARTPQPYNYGQVWYSSDIQNGTAQSLEVSTAHGTTVTGAGSGNGLANGTNKGVAPDSKIIVVQSNLNAQNWTLTVADACDYIFKIADSLNLPAIVNLSLGTYLGSHDGTDAATVLMENLIDSKPGRIIVCAAGNSGNMGNYHVEATVTTDTSLVWFKNNTNHALGSNKVYFDLWSDITDIQNVDFYLGAYKSNGSFAKRGKGRIHNALMNLNQLILDTIRNNNGQILATAQIYKSIQNGVFNMEVFLNRIDTTSYYYSFNTFGQGKYDLWSGTFLGLNEIINNVPSNVILPEVDYYNFPDNTKTIVSAWACSPKIVTVANYHNRKAHINRNGGNHVAVDNPGDMSLNSSRGPNRRNQIKPDISAPGDFTLSTATMALVNNPSVSTGNSLDSGGWHARNGGTSMASPVISGIAALYLEKCNKASYQDFLNDLIANAFADQQTGPTPNSKAGNGKVNALQTLEQTNYTISVSSQFLCDIPTNISVNSTETLTDFIWSNSSTNNFLAVNEPGNYSVTTTSSKGCKSTLNFDILPGLVLPAPIITENANILSSNSQNNYQWHFNNGIINNATQQSYNTTQTGGGIYTVSTTSSTGCITHSAPYQSFLNINDIVQNTFEIYPNPTSGSLTINEDHFEIIKITDILGKNIPYEINAGNKLSINSNISGTYNVSILKNNNIQTIKIVLMAKD